MPEKQRSPSSKRPTCRASLAQPFQRPSRTSGMIELCQMLADACSRLAADLPRGMALRRLAEGANLVVVLTQLGSATLVEALVGGVGARGQLDLLSELLRHRTRVEQNYAS